MPHLPTPPDLDAPPVVLRQPKRFGRLVIANGVLVLLAGVLLGAQYGPWQPLCLAPVVVGGLALAVGVRALRRPNQLELGPEGLTLTTMFRRFAWRWEQVSPFAKTRVSAGRTRADVIGFTSPPDVRPHALPPEWGMPVEEVVALLNQARTKWRS